MRTLLAPRLLSFLHPCLHHSATAPLPISLSLSLSSPPSSTTSLLPRASNHSSSFALSRSFRTSPSTLLLDHRLVPDVDPFRLVPVPLSLSLLVIFQFPSLAPASFVLLLRHGGTFECQPPGRHRSVAFFSLFFVFPARFDMS